MIKPIVKTVSVSAFALMIVTSASALGQNATPRLASMSVESSIATCSSQADIERGWEYQQELLEARLAARGHPDVAVPGAIITSPFGSFPPYRSEASETSLGPPRISRASQLD